jgi:hypothetical protein
MNLIMPSHSRKAVSLYRFQEYPGRDLSTEISSLERFTMNPERGLECIGLIDPVRGGTIPLRFQGSSVVRSDKPTDEISSEDP